MTTTQIGEKGEAFAALALERRGWLVVERNWRCAGGEIDIIARDGDTWVFVEVKLRGANAYGSPEEAVTVQKAVRLLRAAEAYLIEHGLDDTAWRVDVVAIELAASGRVRRLTLYEDAVRFDG